MCLKIVCLQHSSLLCNVTFFYSFSSLPKLLKKTKKNQIYPKKRKGKVFSFCWQHNESPLEKQHPFVCSSSSRIQYDLRKFFSLHRVVSSSIWLSFQTFGEFVLPHASWTYVNAMLPKSHLLSCYYRREVFLSLSRPLCSFSLALMPDHPQSPIKSLFEINESISLMIKIL